METTRRRQITDALSCEEVEILAEDVTELRALERQLRQARNFVAKLARSILRPYESVLLD